jgi:hypothetical protein
MKASDTFEVQSRVILQQLGGSNRLSLMIGAHNFLRSDEDKYVSFKFKQKSPAKINYIKITLNAMDTYDIEFGWIRGLNYTVKKTSEGIYADSLVELIERTTQLHLSL